MLVGTERCSDCGASIRRAHRRALDRLRAGYRYRCSARCGWEQLIGSASLQASRRLVLRKAGAVVAVLGVAALGFVVTIALTSSDPLPKSAARSR